MAHVQPANPLTITDLKRIFGINVIYQRYNVKNLIDAVLKLKDNLDNGHCLKGDYKLSLKNNDEAWIDCDGVLIEHFYTHY